MKERDEKKMSKSIFEEAIEIVAAALDLPDRSVTFKHTGLNVIKKALQQAQKQEKLLNQIKDIINRSYNSYIVSMLEVSEKYAEIVKLIKELENNE